MTSTRTVAVAATLALAAVSWVAAVALMPDMDMGVATRLGPVGPFAAAWTAMTAAMMLPGIAPALARRTQTGGARAAASFVASYLAVWAVVGLAVYALYRPHGTVVAGIAVIVAGIYEVTPVKRHFRRRCHDAAGSGFGFGAHCVGSSIGLTLILLAVGVMSLAWSAVIGAVVCAQKLRPARAAVDVPLALAIVGLGALILAAPDAVPGLVPAM